MVVQAEGAGNALRAQPRLHRLGRGLHIARAALEATAFQVREVVDAMEKVREVVSGTLSLRKAAKIRVRQPLSKLTVVVEDTAAVAAYDEILKSELNVKNVELWQRLDALVSTGGHRIEWRWVKGHSGDPGNERADALANRGVDQALGRR